MTPEVIGTIVAVFGAVATLFAGNYTMLRRFETRVEGRLDTMEAKFETKFEKIDERFDNFEKRTDERSDKLGKRTDERFEHLERRMDERFAEVNSDIKALTHEVTEMKIAIARLEGPRAAMMLPGT